MRYSLPSVPLRFFGAVLVATGLVVVACADVKDPVAPSTTSYPTIVITGNGISKDGPALIPGTAVRVVNADSAVHRLHLDQGSQPGCANLDTGDIPPGESRLTEPVDLDVTACAVHDHMHHGDTRFQVRLQADSGE